ncbi:23S rRNA (uracil(1939)-C(5))-methyltransferase RlmD [Marivirga sp. S37H4]|uniref:23S rRNA (Uracil(1939)-C(5))-methyltransferase RlmD n=1 Tax=Marivirga aurantiaca TaxID=2802615 RepID=A0A934WYR9_9BACT|nr:23S rRNA (uracil(1939)-C(5))-methyltransferase RlmD [Marivirga aurantiaca]MBK6265386.1 23S rRNA (uracil(1939)-C(5))-methyltransferase RlmD [Marivirga aurantiaca]
MARKKHPIIEKLRIEKIAAEGKALGYFNDKVVFVQGTAPGDVVDVRVHKKKKSFLEGSAIKFHERSGLRVEPFCTHYGICGGCKWQHLGYEDQLKFKAQQVTDALERIAKVELPAIQPILASANTTYYRNKLEFTFSNNRWLTAEEIATGENFSSSALGFHVPKRFDKIVQIEHCYLQPEPSNKIRMAVDKIAKENNISYFDIVNQVGFLRNLIIRTTSTAQVMVILQVAEDNEEWLNLILSHLKNTFPEITALLYVINQKGNDTFHGLEVQSYSGQDHILEEMEDLKFKIGPKSFYQTNSEQAYELYKVARNFAKLKGDELVYDLYTGTGTIANFVAGNAKKVIGVEYVEEAIEDAKFNSQLNGIDNTDFYAGDMKDILNDEFIQKNGQPDVIITDPPRAGMHPDVINMLLRIEAQKIVYVSCNPATQARDLALLDEKYKVTAVQPVDMFPQTHHVENVVLLERK